MSEHYSLNRTGSGAVLVTLRGDVDVEIDGALTLILAAVTRAQPADVVVDLAEVEFLGSWGLAFLVRLRKVTGQARRTLMLRQVPHRVHRVIALAGLEDVLLEQDGGQPSPD